MEVVYKEMWDDMQGEDYFDVEVTEATLTNFMELLIELPHLDDSNNLTSTSFNKFNTFLNLNMFFNNLHFLFDFTKLKDLIISNNNSIASIKLDLREDWFDYFYTHVEDYQSTPWVKHSEYFDPNKIVSDEVDSDLVDPSTIQFIKDDSNLDKGESENENFSLFDQKLAELKGPSKDEKVIMRHINRKHFDKYNSVILEHFLANEKKKKELEPEFTDNNKAYDYMQDYNLLIQPYIYNKEDFNLLKFGANFIFYSILFSIYDNKFYSFNFKDMFDIFEKLFPNFSNTCYLNTNPSQEEVIALRSDLPPNSQDIRTIYLFKRSRNIQDTKDYVFDTREAFFNDKVSFFRPRIVRRLILKQELKVVMKQDLAFNDYIVKSYIYTGIYYKNDFEFSLFIHRLKLRYNSKFFNNMLYDLNLFHRLDSLLLPIRKSRFEKLNMLRSHNNLKVNIKTKKKNKGLFWLYANKIYSYKFFKGQRSFNNF